MIAVESVSVVTSVSSVVILLYPLYLDPITAPQLHTWLGGMMGVKDILGSQEAISEAGRLGGCRL